MSRALISSEIFRLHNAYGCTLAALVLPFALIGALIGGIFGRPIERTADDVARNIRARLHGSVLEEDSDYDYDEFSCVPIADPAPDGFARLLRKRAMEHLALASVCCAGAQ
jgi:hypothetical protein